MWPWVPGLAQFGPKEPLTELARDTRGFVSRTSDPGLNRGSEDPGPRGHTNGARACRSRTIDARSDIFHPGHLKLREELLVGKPARHLRPALRPRRFAQALVVALLVRPHMRGRHRHAHANVLVR